MFDEAAYKARIGSSIEKFMGKHWGDLSPMEPVKAKKAKSKKGSEADFNTKLQDFLEGHGILYIRHNPVRIYTNSMGKPAFAPTKHGEPDFIVLHNGKTLYVEGKRLEGGVQSEGQIKWQKRCEASGNEYLLATTVDEVKDALSIA